MIRFFLPRPALQLPIINTLQDNHCLTTMIIYSFADQAVVVIFILRSITIYVLISSKKTLSPSFSGESQLSPYETPSNRYTHMYNTPDFLWQGLA